MSSDDNNPWGKPGNNNGSPWGNNNGGGGQTPPDIDEMLRKAQENWGKMLPGKGGIFVAIIGVVIIAVLWLSSGFYQVKPGESAVIQQFGAWSYTQEEEGLGYHLPWPIETDTIVDVSEVRRMEIGYINLSNGAKRDVAEESLMLTSDANIVDLDLVIQWKISSAEDFLFNIYNQEQTIKKVAESAIREVVGQTSMSQIITKDRKIVANRARAIMIENLKDYKAGVNITQVAIQKATVHPEVHEAYQDVQSAKQDAESTQNKAITHREDIIPKANGRAIKIVQEAEAYRESVIAKATGDAGRFNSVYGAYKLDKNITRERMYIETMESVFANAQKIILDSDGSGIVPYLPINEIGKKK